MSGYVMFNIRHLTSSILPIHYDLTRAKMEQDSFYKNSFKRISLNYILVIRITTNSKFISAESKMKIILIILVVFKCSNKIILHHIAICARNSISKN